MSRKKTYICFSVSDIFMRTLYYNCFAGISGDMNIGAMLDLGVSQEALIAELKKLNLEGWSLRVTKDSRCGIFGTKAEVVLEDHCHEEHHHHHGQHCGHSHRHYADIKKIISDSGLSLRAKDFTNKIFAKVAEAEAKVHNKNIDEVAFHEVGALDSIIDIAAAGICADLLNVDKFVSSPIELGGGTVHCAHGIMPVPAPATAEILKSAPVKLNGAPHEATTPTGAAIIAALCDSFSAKCEGAILASGTGIGGRDTKELPNILRVHLLEEGSGILPCEKMFVIESNIDDMTPEELSYFCETLFDAGASDVWQQAISMKKSRLATMVCALSSAGAFDKLLECFFKNSSTLGVRVFDCDRYFLNRRSESFESSLGRLNFKVSDSFGREKSKPEFEDCRRIAKEKSIPLSEVLRIVRNERKS